MRSLQSLVLCLFALSCLAQQHCLAQQPVPPTEAHHILKKDVGKWTGTMTVFNPGGEPMSLPITEENKLFGDGLWLISEFDAGPFQGRGQFGYDIVAKKYVGTWLDNMSPMMSVMKGDYDAKKKEMVMLMEGYDTATGKMEQMKSVTQMKSDDKRFFTMYVKKDGDWAKAFTIDYQRAE